MYPRWSIGMPRCSASASECPGAKSKVVVSPFHEHQMYSWCSKCPSKIWSEIVSRRPSHTITYHHLPSHTVAPVFCLVGGSHLYCSWCHWSYCTPPGPQHFLSMAKGWTAGWVDTWKHLHVVSLYVLQNIGLRNTIDYNGIYHSILIIAIVNMNRYE